MIKTSDEYIDHIISKIPFASDPFLDYMFRKFLFLFNNSKIKWHSFITGYNKLLLNIILTVNDHIFFQLGIVHINTEKKELSFIRDLVYKEEIPLYYIFDSYDLIAIDELIEYIENSKEWKYFLFENGILVEDSYKIL